MIKIFIALPIDVKNSKIYAILMGIILIYGCKEHDQFDYVYYSKQYCNCYTSYFPKLGEDKTTALCDSILSSENRFFRAFRSNIEIDTFYRGFSGGFRDSTTIFIAGFSNNIYKICPPPTRK